MHSAHPARESTEPGSTMPKMLHMTHRIIQCLVDDQSRDRRIAIRRGAVTSRENFFSTVSRAA